MVICLEQGADLHMAQRMPLPLTVSCFSKIQIGLPFWYQLTRVVLDKGPLNVCVCVCTLQPMNIQSVSSSQLCNQLYQYLHLPTSCTAAALPTKQNMLVIKDNTVLHRQGFLKSWITDI